MKLCTTGKTYYQDKPSAQYALNHIAKQSHKKKYPHRLYRCVICKRYHLSSKDGSSAIKPIKLINEKQFENIIKQQEDETAQRVQK